MAQRNFMELVRDRWQAGTSISVGLDPEPDRFPEELRGLKVEDAVIDFLRRVIISTAPHAAAFKPNSAHFEALGANGFAVLRSVIEIVRDVAPNVPVILDAKRADIGNTNDKYVSAAFDYLGADAITVHPYLGPEAMKPYLERIDNGVIVLVRTSNPGAGRYQDLVVDGTPLYMHVARDVAETWNTNGNCGIVVGATYPEELKNVRTVAPDLPVLVPGIGAQGGDVEATVINGLRTNGDGLWLHAGRSLLYAFENGGSVETATEQAMNDLSFEIAQAVAKR